MLSLIAKFVGTLGYTGVALLMALENIVFPLPSELIMPLAGFLAGRGFMTLPGVIIAGTIGSVIGAIPIYWLGKEVGEDRIAAWIERHGRWLMLRARDIEKADSRFKRRGGRAVFLSQLIPGLRVLIAVPAGVARMNLAWFAVTNLAGTLIWCAVLAVAGQQLGMHFWAVARLMRRLVWVLIVLFVVAAGLWIWRRRHRRRPPTRLVPAERPR